MAELRRKASNFNFDVNLTEQFRARFVCRVFNAMIECKLLQEGDDLTWDRECQVTLSMETTLTDIKLLAGEHREAQMNRVEPPRMTPGERKALTESRWAKD